MRNLVQKGLIAAALSSSLFFVGCNDDDPVTTLNSMKIGGTEQEVQFNTPKYVFMFIGDGLAMPQVNVTEASLGSNGITKRGVQITALEMSKFPVIGQATTHAEDRYITGSAASATALATGEKTTINTISKNGDHTKNLRTIAEMAKDKGMKVGIVSSVSIDHATPACFYAHEETRKNYANIALQMATSGFDYFGGGQAKGAYKEGGEAVMANMASAGYTIAGNKAQFTAATTGKVWAYNDRVDADYALPYDMDRNATDISLAEFTRKGIELMQNNEAGFFMAVEGGKIDWACHANDAVAAMYDVIAFDKAIQEAIKFYNEHPNETIILVTGDHECGGLTIGYAGTGYETAFELLAHQKGSYEAFDANFMAHLTAVGKENVTFNAVLDTLSTYFGFGQVGLELSAYDSTRLKAAFDKVTTEVSGLTPEEEKVAYSYYNPISVTATHILNQKAGLDWTSFKHTALPVPVFAMGEGALCFQGNYDNTDIAKKLMAIAQLQ